MKVMRKNHRFLWKYASKIKIFESLYLTNCISSIKGNFAHGNTSAFIEPRGAANYGYTSRYVNQVMEGGNNCLPQWQNALVPAAVRYWSAQVESTIKALVYYLGQPKLKTKLLLYSHQKRKICNYFQTIRKQL